MEQNLNNAKISYKVFDRKQIHKNKIGNSWAQLDYFDVMRRQWNELCSMGTINRGQISKTKPNIPLMWRQRLDDNYTVDLYTTKKTRPIKDIIKEVQHDTWENVDLPSRLNLRIFIDQISSRQAKKHADATALKTARIAATNPLPLPNPMIEEETAPAVLVRHRNY